MAKDPICGMTVDEATTVEAIKDLQALGLKIVMLTGDNRRAAESVAKQLGLDTVEAEIEPSGKVAHVKKLRGAGNHVAMASTMRQHLARPKSESPWAPAPTSPCKARGSPL